MDCKVTAVTERTPLLNSKKLPRRSKASISSLGLLSKRRILARRIPTKRCFTPSELPANQSNTCTCQNDGTTSLSSASTCHEQDTEESITSLSRTVSAEPDAEVPGACSTSRTGLLHVLDNVSLTLENHGSVARDHLASERTFLAYVRTSLALASAGVALVQLYSVATANGIFHKGHRMHLYIRPLGGLTIGLGITVMSIGVIRYFAVQQALVKGYFPVSRVATAFMAFALITLIVLTFSILIAGKLEPRGL